MVGWLLLAAAYLVVLLLSWAAERRGRLRTPWRLDIAVLGLLALAAVGFFWRVVSSQSWMPADGGDLVSFLFPTYRFAAEAVRGGAWPLWNPHLYGGAPHVGDIQAGFLYPPNLLLFLISPRFPYAALQWLSIAHIWLAGAGMYLFLVRGLGVRRVAALAGAVAFMFSDALVTHFGNLNYNAVASWLPWVLWAFAGSQRVPPAALLAVRLRRSALAGLLLAVATLAGHIQASSFIVLALVILSVLWLWLGRGRPDRGRAALYVLASLAVCLALAALLAAPVLLPSLQLAVHTARAGWSYTEAAGYSLAPAQWIGWLAPGFFGRGPQFHWGAWPRVEVGYLGVLSLVLAGLAIALRRDRRTWAFAGLAGVSFVLAAGVYAIPHGWLTLLPGFGQLRAPARFVLLTDFALAALAAFGLEAVLLPLAGRARAAFERSWRLVAAAVALVWAVGVPLAYLALVLVQDRDPAIVTRTSIALIAILSFAGLLAASCLWLTARRGAWASAATLGWLAVGMIFLDVASLAAYQDLGDRDPSLTYQQDAIAGFLATRAGPFRIDTRTGAEGLWQPDTALLYDLEDVTGVANPLVLADFERYWAGLGSRSSLLYDLLNVQHLIARKDVVLDWDKFVLAFDGDPHLNVYENRDALPRAFAVARVEAAPDHEAAWQAIQAADFDPTVTAFVEGAPPPPAGAAAEVTDISREHNGLAFDVAAEGPAFVVVSQVWHPGWRVWIDDEPAGEPLRTDYLFQGVSVPAGEHRVELRFAPATWRIGWMLAALGGVLLIVLLAAGRLGVRGAPKSAPAVE